MVALGGRVLQREFNRQARPNDIVSPDVEDGRGVRGRLDLAHVDLFQLLDVMEHIAELVGKRRLLLGREREARELGDVV